MQRSTKRIVGTCAGALTLTAAALLPTATAFAATSNVTVTQPSVPTIAPGSSGTVNLTLTSGTGGATVNSLVWTAPANTTFSTTGYQVNGSPGAFSCTPNASSTVLTCNGGGQWAAGSYTLSVGVAVGASAPAGTTLTGGSLAMTDNTNAPYTNSPYSFAVQTPAVAPTPMASPAGAASGIGALMLGTVLVRRRRSARAE